MRDAFLADVKWNHGMFLWMLEDVPEEKMTFQTCATDNHVLWQIGHLITGNAYFQSRATGQPMKLDEKINTLFGHGSKPVSDRSVYPPTAEVKRLLEESLAEFVRACSTKTDEQLLARLPDGDDKFIANGMQAIARNAWHYGWHSGQIAGSRKALGLKPKM